LLEYLLIVAFFYMGTAATIRLMGKRVEASLFMATQTAVSSKFQPYMEGLRGLLAINIILIHDAEIYSFGKRGILFPWLEFEKQIGVLAVIYFFLMTGYLLWKGMIDNPNFSASRFLKGRFFRLFPAYSVTILIIFGIALAKAGFHLRVPLWKFIATLFAWLTFGVIKAPPINGYANLPLLGAGVMWTLQVDWVYYLIYPLLVWFSRKHWRLIILIGAALLLYLPIKMYPGHLVGNGKRLQFFMSYFCTVISLGMVLAAVKSRWPEWPWARTRWASFVAVGGTLAVECCMPCHWGLIETLLVLPPFVLCAYGNDFYGLFSTRTGLYLGRISYSVYLLHAVTLIACARLLRPYIHIAQLSKPMYWLLMAPIGMITLWAAMLLHRFVEMPSTSLGRRRPAKERIPTPAHASSGQIGQAIQEEAAQLPGNAEAEIQFDPKVRN
jgi:peptidoglycan/LPS O-acetylase OafA/YrhL